MEEIREKKSRTSGFTEVDSEAQFPQYRNDPHGFFVNVIGLTPWEASTEVLQQGRCGQADIIRALPTYKSIAVRSGHKVGKLLHPDTPIPTPRGWRRYGDLAVGDEVFSDTGHPCRIIGESYWPDRPILRVHFEDGTFVDADEAHEWVVRTRESRKRREKGTQTLETCQLADALTVPNGQHPDGTTRRIANFTLPCPGPLQLPEQELLLDPYLLGLWLGDGTSDGGGFTGMDGLERAFADAGFTVVARSVPYHFYVRGLRPVLRSLGVLNNKHVPEQYLWSSADQRLALLQGLMDTDGSCAKRSRLQFCNTNKLLADAVVHLARSLGFKTRIKEKRAMLEGRDVGPKWHVEWMSPAPVFRLERKLARLRTTWVHKFHCHKSTAIVAIEPMGRVDSKCIEVDSPSHLYLCGPSMVPTHNSTSAAGIALWWYACQPAGRAILTAPTGRQVKFVLWREIRRMLRKSRTRIEGDCSLAPEAGMHSDDDREILGFSTDDPDRFSGISGNVLYIADEASGIAPEIFEAIEGNRAGGSYLLLLGNPTQTSGKFYDAFHNERSDFHTLHISSEDTPKSATVSRLAQDSWVESRRRIWGVKSPIYQVRVLGDFPSQAENAVISLSLLQDALARYEDTEFSGELRIGVDPARFGDDETVIQPVRGQKTYPCTALRSLDSIEIAHAVLDVARELRSSVLEIPVVNVDTIGIGAGVYDQLNRILDVAGDREVLAIACDSSRGSDKPEEYYNLRSQLYFGLRDWLQEGGALHSDPVLEGELVAPTYTFDAQNRYKVESKAEIKERLGHSPDRMDGLQLAVYPSRHRVAMRVPTLSGSRWDSLPGRGFG